VGVPVSSVHVNVASTFPPIVIETFLPVTVAFGDLVIVGGSGCEIAAETATGVVLPAPVVPSPNCPSLFMPQHLTVPLTSTAHEWNEPAVISFASVMPVTVTGTLALDRVPSPN
jgi:hypothetical protein